MPKSCTQTSYRLFSQGKSLGVLGGKRWKLFENILYLNDVNDQNTLCYFLFKGTIFDDY